MKRPNIAIIGRPNVGKSSLFNLLARRRISIVDPTAGVTRDRLTTEIQLPDGPCVQIMDTGGYGVEDVHNLTAEIERHIAVAVAEADLVLFVVDAQTGIVPLDEQVARLLRSSNTGKTKVLLVCNKVDGEDLEHHAYEASSLGFGNPVMISATTKYKRNAFLEAIRDAIDLDVIKDAEGLSHVTDAGMLLALVGKRNAGKSTLTNAIANEERVIVSDKEGTTRDSVDVRLTIKDRAFTLIDTAGVRKHKSIKSDIEFYSHHRSLRAIRRADVTLFIIDASVPISQVDKQLGNEILKHHKPVVLVVNKWDLAEKNYTKEEYAEYLDKAMKGLDFAPLAFLSAKNKQGLKDVMAMAFNLHQQAQHRVTTGQLNRITQGILEQRLPPATQGKRLRVFYVTQLDICPPTIGLFVNHPDLCDPNYERFLINRYRDELPYSEVPIKLVIRERRQTSLDTPLDERKRTPKKSKDDDDKPDTFSDEYDD